MTDTTPTLAEVISLAGQNLAQQLRVCLPAVIVAVRGNQLVDVQPLLRVQAVAKSAPERMKVLPNVPVSMPRGKTWGIRLPIAVGDTGLLIFADRDMDAWLSGTGAMATPASTRAHDLTDGIFCPGLGPDSAQSTDTTTDLVLTNGAAELRLTKAGQFKLMNDGSQQELLSLVSQLVVMLQNALVLTALGPQGLIVSQQAQLLVLKSKLDTLTQGAST